MTAQIATPARRTNGKPHTAFTSRPRTGKVGRRLRAYTYFIRLMRIVLPLLTVAAIGLVIAWPSLRNDKPSVLATDPGGPQMLNSRYSGVDQHNRPYTITADSAIQSSRNADTVDMVNPVAEMALEDGSWVALKSNSGHYNQKEGKLVMDGNVELFHSLGYQATTEQAFADVRAGTAWGDRPVSGHGPGGQVDALGFRIFDRGNSIVFTGNPKLILRPSKDNT
jgi:lipopolysaccharide export system protein LptC